MTTGQDHTPGGTAGRTRRPRGAHADVVYAARGRALVSVSGELDFATADAVAAELAHAALTVGPSIEADVSRVAFCDAYGLAALLRAAARAERAGGALTLHGVGADLDRLLAITDTAARFGAPGAVERPVPLPGPRPGG
ncbi:STAS domain-containing protein [Nocardiopsis mangrovi]|uniref:STAS domain-containing protein n=1 Tax=Nocardiopsis mangrovi TaxID=1179818 RepID=A0ABV9DQD6_9ACTN